MYEAVQFAVQTVKEADGISTVISVVAIALLTASKVGWDWYKKRKELKGDCPPAVTIKSASKNINSIEALSETYTGIIRELREQMEQLQREVEELATLKQANEYLEHEVKELKKKHEECTNQNETQAAQIVKLTRKVNNLAKNQKARPVKKGKVRRK